MSNTAPTTKAEALDEALNAIRRADRVFINPPPRAMDLCAEPLCKADKARRDLHKRPNNEARLTKAVKALNRAGYAFEHLAQIHRDAGKIEDAMVLTSLGHALHDVGNKLLRTFSQP